MQAEIALEAVLVELVMLERLGPMEVAAAVAAAEALDVAVGEQVALELVRPRELAHAAEVAAERALEALAQVVDEHVTAQPVFSLETRRTVLPTKRHSQVMIVLVL